MPAQWLTFWFDRAHDGERFCVQLCDTVEAGNTILVARAAAIRMVTHRYKGTLEKALRDHPATPRVVGAQTYKFVDARVLIRVLNAMKHRLGSDMVHYHAFWNQFLLNVPQALREYGHARLGGETRKTSIEVEKSGRVDISRLLQATADPDAPASPMKQAQIGPPFPPCPTCGTTVDNSTMLRDLCAECSRKQTLLPERNWPKEDWTVPVATVRAKVGVSADVVVDAIRNILDEQAATPAAKLELVRRLLG